MDEIQHPEISRRELFDFACGDLDPRRRAMIAQRARVDQELAAKIAFFRLFVPGDRAPAIPSIKPAVRMAIISSVWGVAIGIADNSCFELASQWELKPVALGALFGVVGLGIMLLGRQRGWTTAGDHGTLFEALELTVFFAVPLGLVAAMVALFSGANRLMPIGFILVGVLCSFVGAIAGTGLRNAITEADPAVSDDRRVARGVLYFLVMAPGSAVISLMIGVVMPAWFAQFAPLPPALVRQFLLGSSLFALVLPVSIGVRAAFDDTKALKEDARSLATSFASEVAVALFIGPLVLMALVAVFGDFRPLVFFIAVGSMSASVVINAGWEAIEGRESAGLTRIQETAAKMARRGIKVCAALALAVIWRQYCLKPNGFDDLRTQGAAFACVIIISAIERLSIPVERIMFGERAKTKTYRAAGRSMVGLQSQLLLQHATMLTTGLVRALAAVRG